MTIIVFGDSITNRACDLEGGGWTSRLWAHLYSFSNTQYENGVIDPNYTVIELGIGGDTIVGISQRFKSELLTRIDVNDKENLKQTIVGIAVGINDSRIITGEKDNFVRISEFISLYKDVVNQLQQLGLPIFTVGLTPVDETKVRPCLWEPQSYINEEIEKYNAAIEEISKSYKTIFVDVLNPLRALIETNNPSYVLDPDGLHPNAKGHEVIAEEVFNAIRSIL